MINNFVYIEGNGLQIPAYCFERKRDDRPVYYIRDKLPGLDSKCTYNIVYGKYVIIVRDNIIKNIIHHQLLTDINIIDNTFDIHGRPLYLKTKEDYDLYQKGEDTSYINYIKDCTSEIKITKNIYRICRVIRFPISKYILDKLSTDKKKEILISLLRGQNINLGEMINEDINL